MSRIAPCSPDNVYSLLMCTKLLFPISVVDCEIKELQRKYNFGQAIQKALGEKEAPDPEVECVIRPDPIY